MTPNPISPPGSRVWSPAGELNLDQPANQAGHAIATSQGKWCIPDNLDRVTNFQPLSLFTGGQVLGEVKPQAILMRLIHQEERAKYRN
jgi:hypothetical protein